MPDPANNPTCTACEFAKRLGVPEKTLLAMERRGELPLRIHTGPLRGRAWDRRVVDRWIRGRRTGRLRRR